MAGTIGKNLHLCFTKIKRPLDTQSPSSHLQTHPLVIKNYNSLYDYALDSGCKSPTSSSTADDPSSSFEPDFATIYASRRFFFSSPGLSNSIIESTPSFATATESSDSPVSNAADTPISDTCSTTNQYSDWSSSYLESPTVKDSVAVPTYSPDPYLDFRRSMQEMVEARRLVDVKAHRENLHELLLCYLALNPKNTHKCIIRAFADLLVSLLASPPPTEVE